MRAKSIAPIPLGQRVAGFDNAERLHLRDGKRDLRVVDVRGLPALIAALAARIVAMQVMDNQPRMEASTNRCATSGWASNRKSPARLDGGRVSLVAVVGQQEDIGLEPALARDGERLPRWRSPAGSNAGSARKGAELKL